MSMHLGRLIPILALMIPIVAIWAWHLRKLAEMRLGTMAEQTAGRAAQYAAQIQPFEDRVRVLESIVAGRGSDIATQIEALHRDHLLAASSHGKEAEQ
jgi:hypothetical protein